MATRLWEPIDSEREQVIRGQKVTIQWNVRVKQIGGIMRDVANGTAFIHSLKEIHRDLKPRNSIRPELKDIC